MIIPSKVPTTTPTLASECGLEVEDDVNVGKALLFVTEEEDCKRELTLAGCVTGGEDSFVVAKDDSSVVPKDDSCRLELRLELRLTSVTCVVGSTDACEIVDDESCLLKLSLDVNLSDVVEVCVLGTAAGIDDPGFTEVELGIDCGSG